MSRTIFVIGANSALARAAIKVLVGDSTIITAGRKNCDVYCDIAKPFDIPANVDVVLNFAAAFGGTEDNEIVDAVSVNSTGILNICIAAKKANVAHIINVSSLSAVLDEKSPYYSIYAISKRHGDELAEFYCSVNKLPLTILRPSQVYGDDDSFALHQPLFYQVIEKAQKGEDVVIYGKHDALRNYIHANDISELIRGVVEQSIVGTYPCLSPSNIAYSQLAKTAQSVFQMGGDIRFLSDKPDIPDNVFSMDLSIYEKTGYMAQISIEAGIRRIKAYQQGTST
jgi:nucleoside-diphosphate-sugar epimerase